MSTQTLTPHLVVKGAVAAIEYYKAALGATELCRMPTEDGRLMHASLQIGDSNLMLCDDFPEYCGGDSRAPNGPSPVTLHLNVENCDTAIAQAEAAGAKVTMPAADMFWGMRYGQVVDPFGHTWSYGHPLAKEQSAAA